MAVLINTRLNAMWQVAATLNMANASNTFLSTLKTQPDGVYALANMQDNRVSCSSLPALGEVTGQDTRGWKQIVGGEHRFTGA